MEQCTLLVLSSFAFKFPNLKGINCTSKLCEKNYIYIGHRAHSRANHNPSFLPGPLLEKHYRILGMRARLPDQVIFMRSKGGCAVQY